MWSVGLAMSVATARDRRPGCPVPAGQPAACLLEVFAQKPAATIHAPLEAELPEACP
jgi:hypothetical protein